MIAAFACYENRLAALLDTAVQFQLYHLDGSKAAPLERLTLPDLPPLEIINILSQRDVEVIVCGAVSDHMQNMLSRSSIQLRPWVCGELNLLSEALASGNLDAFAMPGCCGRRRQCRRPVNGKKWKQTRSDK